jgi:Holliday junction resolvasome RuvABC endonuclease subunit
MVNIGNSFYIDPNLAYTYLPITHNVIGIDPGLMHVGVACYNSVESSISCCTVNPSEDLFKYIKSSNKISHKDVYDISKDITRQLLTIISKYNVSYIVCEDVYPGINAWAALSLGIEIGFMFGALHAHYENLHYVVPPSIGAVRKQTLNNIICGNAKATKAQVRRGIEQSLGFKFVNPNGGHFEYHVSDAVATIFGWRMLT